MKYEIIVFDLDGTLTNSQKVITPKTKEAIMKAQENGTIVVLASGRPTYGIIKVAKELDLYKYGGYILAYNGSCIFDCKNEKYISETNLPKEYISDIIDFSKGSDLAILTYDKNVIVSENTENKYVIEEQRINGMESKKVFDLKAYLDYDIAKLLICGDPIKVARAEKFALKKFKNAPLNIFRSEAFFLEVVPQNIDKAYSLEKLLNILGKKPEQMICCGDGYNDISMIKYAGLGVAMSNAKDTVKYAADVLAGSNDDDGLVGIIEKYL